MSGNGYFDALQLQNTPSDYKDQKARLISMDRHFCNVLYLNRKFVKKLFATKIKKQIYSKNFKIKSCDNHQNKIKMYVPAITVCKL